MTRRSVGKATISFGLVSIPTKLYNSGDGSNRIAFNQLSPKGEKLRQQYIDPAGNVVEHKDMLKGYAYEKDRYVTFTQEEIKAIQEPRTPVVSITAFVPDMIPLAHHDAVYYLTPDAGGEKAYELLRRAMLKSGRVALTKHCSHGKQHLACIRATSQGLLMQHLLYRDEVHPFDEVYTPPATKVTDAEMRLATQLIGMISTDEPVLDQERDEVRERMQAAIDAKVAGKAIEIPAAESGPAATQDLLAVLEKSLAKAA